MEHFEKIEMLFADFFAACELSTSESSEVMEFVKFGEYGIAFETAVAILVTKNEPVSDQIMLVLQQSSDLMEMDLNLMGELKNIRRVIPPPPR